MSLSETMAALFASGHVADFIIVLMVVEGIAIYFWQKRSGRGVAPTGLVFMLAAGIFLLLALRAALTDTGWPAVALFLALGGVAHLADLSRRWR